jgi:predicted O-methyltransferase YrrM
MNVAGTTKGILMGIVNSFLSPIHFRHAVRKLAALEAQCLIETGDLFDVPFKYRGLGIFNKISPTQNIAEVRELYDAVRAINPRFVCEIGTDKGGTFYLLCKASSDNAVVVSVDLPSRRHYSPARRKFYSHFQKTDSQIFHFIPNDSHNGATLSAVKEAVGGNQLDFLFIDGDHTYEGVRQDYDMYSPMVRPNGLIALHDIRTQREDCGVPKFWKELIQIPGNYREVATQAHGPLGAGIGLVVKSREMRFI